MEHKQKPAFEERYQITTKLGPIALTTHNQKVKTLSFAPPKQADPSPPPAIAELLNRIQAFLNGEQLLCSREGELYWQQFSAFQAKVYQSTRAIAPGHTKTYGQIAEAIGQPKAARAVGQALGKNPLPLLIPCHRVVSLQGLGGFSIPGGEGLKEALQNLEQRLVFDRNHVSHP